METVNVLPSLWIDWCAATGTPVALRDEVTLSRFTQQTRPSQSVLKALQPTVTMRTPAWPSTMLENPNALHQLLRAGTNLAQGASTSWASRLRIRRLLFTAVLIAPETQGGFGLTRAQIRALTPHSIEQRLPDLENAVEQAECISCTAWAWLDILGANSNWSRGGIRQLIHQREVRTNCPRHRTRTPSDAWKDWPNYPNLLPAIDRWGWINPYSSVHPSSLSTLIRDLEQLYEEPPEPIEEPLPQTLATPPRISPEEEAAILARADEVNARVAALLHDYE